MEKNAAAKMASRELAGGAMAGQRQHIRGSPFTGAWMRSFVNSHFGGCREPEALRFARAAHAGL